MDDLEKLLNELFGRSPFADFADIGISSGPPSHPQSSHAQPKSLRKSVLQQQQPGGGNDESYSQSMSSSKKQFQIMPNGSTRMVETVCMADGSRKETLTECRPDVKGLDERRCQTLTKFFDAAGREIKK